MTWLTSKCAHAASLVVLMFWPLAAHGQGIAEWWEKLHAQFDETSAQVEDPADHQRLSQLESGKLGEAGRDLLQRLDNLLGQQKGQDSGQVVVDEPGPSASKPLRLSAGHQPEGHAADTDSWNSGTDRDKPQTPQTIYRYRGKHGREVFTNIAQNVPASPDSTRMELQHVPLNSELGTQISQRLAQAHARLSNSSFCKHARARASDLPPSAQGEFATLWESYAPVLVFGALLLVLFLITPAMHRRVDPQAWRRVMMFAIPALAVAAFVTQSMMHVSKSVVGLRQAAQICDPRALSDSSRGASPLSAKFELITALQKEMARADAIQQAAPQAVERPGR